jgi:hypothetical protein
VVAAEMYVRLIIIAQEPVNLELQSLPLKIMNRSAAPVEMRNVMVVVLIF